MNAGPRRRAWFRVRLSREDTAVFPTKGEWIKGAIVTLVVIAIVWRVPQVRSVVVGS